MEEPKEGLALEVLCPQPLYCSVRLSIALPRETHVNLRLFDTRGRQVAGIADGLFSAGQHSLSFDGGTSNKRLSPGVYFLRMEACGKVINRKVVLVR